jgi:hypothetical protein
MSVGRLERSLRAYGIVYAELMAVIVFFAFLIYFGNVYLAVSGAFLITMVVFVIVTHHIRLKTGRWWFRSMWSKPLRHFPMRSPRYDTSLVDFYGVVEPDFGKQWAETV